MTMLTTSVETETLMQPIDVNESDVEEFKENILSGNYNTARDQMRKACIIPTINTDHAIVLDKGSSTEMPRTVVRRQSKLPNIFRHFTPVHKGSKRHLAAHETFAERTTEKDKLLQ